MDIVRVSKMVQTVAEKEGRMEELEEASDKATLWNCASFTPWWIALQ